MRTIYWTAEDSKRRRVAEGQVQAKDDRAAVVAALDELPRALAGSGQTVRGDECYRVRAGSAFATAHGDELGAVATSSSMADALSPGRAHLHPPAVEPDPGTMDGFYSLAIRLIHSDPTELARWGLGPNDIQVVFPTFHGETCQVTVSPAGRLALARAQALGRPCRPVSPDESCWELK